MKVLGLSSNYHDASAALVIDGEVAAAAAEERFTLRKHDPTFPRHAARFCLEQAGLTAADLDLVAYHEQPEVKFSRALCTSFARFPFSVVTFIKSMREAISSGLWIRNQISAGLDCDPDRIVYVPHHLSHATHAYLSSPFENAAILTIDAVGEWTCTGLFRGRMVGKRPVIEPLDVVPFPHSIGLVYSAFTAYLGFAVNDGECSTMALAAFGRPRYADAVREVLPAKADGSYEVDLSFFDFGSWESAPVTRKFITRFGAPRPFKSTLPFDCLADEQGPCDEESRRYADIAASIQLVLEERVIALARRARELTGCRHLCLAGGVALNCVSNGCLLSAGVFDDIFIPPDPGDGGGAMGAALHAHMSAAGTRAAGRLDAYRGKAYDAGVVADMLPHLDARRWARYAGPGARGERARAVTMRRCAAESETLSRAVDALASGRLVGWVQGRFENGPRALGNRSILADPSNIESARRLSRSVKGRASFRPYSFAVTREDSGKVLASSAPDNASRWMQRSWAVRPEAVPRLRAALHVDKTSRPQICSVEDNPLFHRLLTEFGRKKGLAALLNTSFNESGAPLVASPTDALMTFARTGLDMLVVGDVIIERTG